MVRWGWLAALLICVAAHAGENDGGADVASDAAATASAAACSHASTTPIAATVLPAASIPHPQDRVTDLTGALSEACKADLTQRLATLEQQTGAQLAVLLVPSTGDDTIEQYARKIFEEWKLGQREVNNGVLLVAALHDHRVRIEVGYGLEGAITDATAGRIIRERVVPAFRDGNYEGGISAAVDELVQRLGASASSDASDNASATKAVAPDYLTEPPPRYPGAGPLFWIALALLNVGFGAIAAWRRIEWGYGLGGSYVVTALAGLFFGSSAFLDPMLRGSGGTLILPALMLPAIFSWPLFALGRGLFNSKRTRQYTVTSFGLLCVSLIAGCAMGYRFVNVLVVASLIVTALTVAWMWIEAALSAPRRQRSLDSSASYGAGWISNSDSSSFDSSSSDGGWSGGGGDSGGGGASGSW
jgi:uncharacterized protein